MIYALIMAVQILTQAADDFDYGEAFVSETQDRKAPRLHLGAGYGFNISNSFIEVDSLMLTGQVRVWKYFSTGVLAQVNKSELSPAGQQIRNLEAVDLHAVIPIPRWGVFSVSYLQFMLGRWNLMNLLPLESELLAGGGAGVVNRGRDTNGPNESQFSYLWSVENRFAFKEKFGVFVSVLGERDTAYFQSGVFARFE